jgi:hypothetical protein
VRFGGAFIEVLMYRVIGAVLAAMPLVILGASGQALAQAGCQPTITQPCAKPDTPAAPAAKRPGLTTDDNNPTDHSTGVKDKDTGLKFGPGGLGIGRKF